MQHMCSGVLLTRRRTGHYYSNPSNWMWRILIATKIAPEHVTDAQVNSILSCMLDIRVPHASMCHWWEKSEGVASLMHVILPVL